MTDFDHPSWGASASLRRRFVHLFVRVTAVASIASLATSLAACRVLDPPSEPEGTCTRACASRASNVCSERQCERGCRFVLDRLVEREGEHVIACVARGPGPCDDALFATCAARIGEHADGGPPPPPPSEDE